jgi:hypothetical protein
LVQDLTGEPARAEARKIARRLRPAFRLSPKKEKRLSLLLAKGNAGTLTASETEEVDALVREVESNMVEYAKEVDSTIKHRGRANGRNGSTAS